jgi:Flp pilus assembly CpaE family ATPase
VTAISILSAKGGAGASLLATNLGVCLAGTAECVLMDLHPGAGYDDLLLDLSPERSWADLLHVAEELTPRHLELTLAAHETGLKLLGAPERMLDAPDHDRTLTLLRVLGERIPWLVLDLPVGLDGFSREIVRMSDLVLLVSTADPLALRAAGRTLAALSETVCERTALVLNQITRRHPAAPREVAASLGVKLLAALPPDPRAVGYQVNFGRPCALDRRSALGRAVAALTRRLTAMAAQQDRRASHTSSASRRVGVEDART